MVEKTKYNLDYPIGHILHEAAKMLDQGPAKVEHHIGSLDRGFIRNELTLRECTDEILKGYGLPYDLIKCIRLVLCRPRGFETLSFEHRFQWRLFEEMKELKKLTDGTKTINGSSYVGEIDLVGRACGHGELTYASGARARGTFLNDELHGYIEYHHSNGDKRCGEFSKGLRHGK